MTTNRGFRLNEDGAQGSIVLVALDGLDPDGARLKPICGCPLGEARVDSQNLRVRVGEENDNRALAGRRRVTHNGLRQRGHNIRLHPLREGQCASCRISAGLRQRNALLR